MDTNRIREIHKGTAYPESRSVYQALLQVWNECEQEKQMNKGKIIDADKLKEIICKYYNPKLYEHIFKIIDELSEDREDVVRIKGSEFCNEEPNEYMKFTDWAVREGYTTKVPNSIMNLFIHYLESINKHKKEQPTPLKVAIKGDGTKEYGKKIIEYFGVPSKYKCLSGSSFYFINKKGRISINYNLPEGYTEISLKEEKELNHCICGNPSDVTLPQFNITLCDDCKKPLKEETMLPNFDTVIGQYKEAKNMIDKAIELLSK